MAKRSKSPAIATHPSYSELEVAIIRTGNGRDEVAIKDSLFSRLSVETGNGRDSLSLEDVIVQELFEFDGGRGVDQFHDNGGNELPTNGDVNNCDDDHDGDEDDDDFDGDDEDNDSSCS